MPAVQSYQRHFRDYTISRRQARLGAVDGRQSQSQSRRTPCSVITAGRQFDVVFIRTQKCLVFIILSVLLPLRMSTGIA